MKDFASDPLQIGVIGAGVMGRGIAQLAATAGIDVILYDLDGKVIEEALEFIKGMLDRAVEKGRMERQAAEQSKGRISQSTELSSLASADLVIEAVVEKIEVKQQLFAELEAMVSSDCILATNTSSLSVTAVAATASRAERVAGFHFFNPVPLMKLVEVIAAVRTSAGVCEALQALARRLGHTPVMVNDSPGFLVNHTGRGLITEGLRVLYETVTDAQTVDAIMRDCMGFRMGPFELMDLTGLDVTFPASEQVYMQYFQEPRVRPTPLQRRRYIAGLLGRKTGEGFYVYRDGNKVMHEEPVFEGGDENTAFWISRQQPVFADRLVTLLRDAGLAIDEGERPGESSIALVTPLGLDTTSAALLENLPPQRTLAVDMLGDTGKRLVLMGSPAVENDLKSACAALLSRAGRKVSLIRDSGGFVAQRIIATIINIATDIAQQGIARPQDIDTGAQLGLGYPQGPLAMGDAYGAASILRILENLLEVYGDPRYRPSPWLKRRAQLGMSLLTEEL